MMQRKLFSLICALLLTAGTPRDRVLALLERLPPAYVDRHESSESRLARMQVIADAWRPYSVRERAAGLAVWWGETKLAAYTRDNCTWRPPGSVGDCDKGKARGYGQHHEASCPQLWRVPVGSDESVVESAKCTVRLLRFGFGRCGTIAGAMAVYGGLPCQATTPNIQSKLSWYRRLGGE